MTPEKTTRLTGLTILQVIPALETGGAERTVLEVAEAVIAAGGRAVVASEGGEMTTALTALGAKHVTLPLASKNPLTMFLNERRLRQLITEEKVDLVHARSRAPAWSAWGAARQAGVPFVTTYHGIYKARNGLKRHYNSIMARGDMVIANSDYTRSEVIAEHHPDTLKDVSNIITIPRGADLARFDPAAVEEARIAALEEAWQGRDRLRLILPGRLTEWKGQRTLIEAAGILRISSPGIRLRIVLAGADQGRTAYRQSLEEAIQAEGVEDMVILPGNCRDMPAAFKWADLAISASLRPEAFGRVAVEAQAMGCPVIASDHGGARETVVDSKTGYLVPPGDARALAAAIARFEEMHETDRNVLSGMAIAHVRQHFSIGNMTSATLDVYKKLLM